MKLPKLPLWLASGTCAIAALLLSTSTSEAEFPWFHKPKCCPPEVKPEVLPEIKPEIKPEVKPETKPEPKTPETPPTPEPTAEPVTTAALGGSGVSINMFGDRFGTFGGGTVQIIRHTTFNNFLVFNQNSSGNFVAPIPPG